jgi:hypothetical protein
MNKKFEFIWGNVIYSILVVPSFIYFIVNDQNDQFAALFIAGLTLPWSFTLAFILGALNIDTSNKLAVRSFILLIFVILNQIIIWFFFKRSNFRSI